MSKPIIAVDIDEVLAAQAPSFVAYSNQQWGMSLTIDDYTEHWAAVWQVDHEETLRRAKQYNFSGALESMSHFEEALAVLSNLAKTYELVIVTARRKELAESTQHWIDTRYTGVFSHIHYAGIWDTDHPNASTFTKAELCAEINADYLIDDQSKHCNAAQLAGIQAVMFGDYPWNRADDIASGVVRCSNWDEVLGYFREQAER